ncbi:MAG: hypothetical protein EP297_01640 [Gammaproteobacteria bacterium]|nr:MAG: hypothetical protein EP297_01640 [Gammaproteobacteria bacterium]
MEILRAFSRFGQCVFLAVVISAIGINIASATIHDISSSNLTVLDPFGGLVNGGATDVYGTYDDSKICSSVSCSQIGMTLATNQEFLGIIWNAHDIRVFSEGTYTFDTACTPADIAAGITDCGGGAPLTLTVPAGQLGAHMLIDWAGSTNIDVAVLWNPEDTFGSPIYDGCLFPSGPDVCDPTHSPTRIWDLASKDGNGDGLQGIPMVDGPFTGFYANFSLNFGPTPPGITVAINVAGGELQECMDTGGSTVTISAETMLFGDAELASVEWTVDGVSAGSGETITPFLEVGSHTVEALATTTTGESDTDLVIVTVTDTVAPDLEVAFVDGRSGVHVSQVERANVQWIVAHFVATDACDPNPVASGVGGFSVQHGDLLKVQGNLNSVTMTTSELELGATATDISGNTSSGSASLYITD